MMKKYLKWAFVLTMILAMVAIGAVACDDDETEEPTAPVTEEATAPATEEPEKEAYKIGAVLSISGPASSLGIPEENTAKMMEDQINAAGGINGHPIKMVVYDDETSPEKCATLTTRLVEQDNVLAIVGPTTSGNSMAIIDIVTNAEVPLVSCAAAISIVTPIEERYWVFKTPQTEKEAVTEIYTYMQTNGITKVALITDTSGFGAAGLAFLAADAEGYGIEVVAEQTFDSGDPSMEAQLTNIMGSDAEAVICWATSDESATVALDMQTLGIEIPLYCSHGIANIDFIDQAGEAANGVIFPAGKLLFVDRVLDGDPQKPVLVNYIADYEAINGEGTMSTFGGHLYDALSMVAIALAGVDEGASTADARSQIRDGLEQITEFAGTGGVFTMSPENHLGMAPGSLGMIEIVDEAWTLAP
ncbi:MAG: ABC transporter substrate-binding protein [Chloroflexi bacterium]|nr:ABC transporter substrate-binding protein [Chloroflexota bacterium]